MAKRKSLLESVDGLSEEEKAFIDGGRPKPTTKPPNTIEAKEPPLPGPEAKPLPKRTKPGRHRINSQEGAEGPVVLVADTFKIPQEIARRLLEASFSRKITRTKPYTKQAIVAEALDQWLSDNSF